ncbi:unnamed protein product, partial [Didymodactylos carnosus]
MSFDAEFDADSEYVILVQKYYGFGKWVSPPPSYGGNEDEVIFVEERLVSPFYGYTLDKICFIPGPGPGHNTDQNIPNNPEYRYPNNRNQAISKEPLRPMQDDYDEDLIFQGQQYTHPSA